MEIRIRRLTGYYRRSAPLVFRGHSHRDREYKVVLSGALEVTYDNRIFHLGAGDVMLTEPFVFHRERTLSEDCTYIVLQLEADGIPPAEYPRIRHPEGEEAALSRLLCDYLAKLPPNRPWQGEAPPIPTVLLRLAEAALDTLCYATPEEAREESEQEALYRRAVDLMRRDLSRHLSIAALSRALGTSPTHLKGVFSTYTGHGVQRHYLDLRMEAARSLLCEGIPAAEVAARLGFSSPSYFSQCFLRECGCTPRQYRQRNG